MKAIYIKPITEKVNLNLKKAINWGDDSTSQWEHETANDTFFAEEDFDDDEYDPFFDE